MLAGFGSPLTGVLFDDYGRTDAGSKHGHSIRKKWVTPVVTGRESAPLSLAPNQDEK